MRAKLWALPAKAKKIAAFNADGYLYTTNDFDASSPTWSRESLNVMGIEGEQGIDFAVIDFAIDPFSPRYVGSGDTVNGWLATTYGIYQITDIFGVADGPTVTLQHTFAHAATSRVWIEASWVEKGWVICLYRRRPTDPTGLWAVYTRDGGQNWAENTNPISSAFQTNPGAGGVPALYLSRRTPGLAYAGVITLTGSNEAAETGLYKTLDYGASWALSDGLPIDFGDDVTTSLHFPWHDNPDEQIVYWNHRDLNPDNNTLHRFDGVTEDIAPRDENNRPYGPRAQRGVATHLFDRQTMLAVLSVEPSDAYAVFVSRHGGDDLEDNVIVAKGGPYRCGYIAGSDSSALYLLGPAGAIGYSDDFGATAVQNRRGNIASMTPAAGEFIALVSDTIWDLDAPHHKGPCECTFGHEMYDCQTTDNPISLREGEKRLEATDLTLQTPAGPLSFTRAYRQSVQKDPAFQFMGLGWTHNHAVSLTKITGTPNTIIVHMPRGGEAHFTETVTSHYQGDPGSTSVIDWNNNQYTLTAADKSTYVFDSTGKLISRSWPNGEIWTYSYSDSKLGKVEDSYGNRLVFRYYPDGPHQDQLRRVGDQTFDDTDLENPAGRYVEFQYTLDKIVDNDGAIVDGEGSLLTCVYDVLGRDWTYTYYAETGQDADVRQLNFLIKRESPSVDTDGDETPDGCLTLEELTYTLQGEELAQNGGMEEDGGWTSITSASHVWSTAQVDSGTHSRLVNAAVDDGIQGNQWDLVEDLTYLVTARVYPVSGAVKMHVTGGAAFDRVTNNTGGWETLRAVHQATADASDVRLQFMAHNGAAEFYVDSVSVIETNLSVAEIIQERGEAAVTKKLAFQPGDDNITTEEVPGTTIKTTHRFSGSVYAGADDPLGHMRRRFLNTQYRPNAQADANGNLTQMSWSDDGKHLSQVTDALENSTKFDYDGEDRLERSTDAQGRKTAYIYDAHSRQPTMILIGDGAVPEGNIDIEAADDWSVVGSASRSWLSPHVDTGGHSRYVSATQGEGIASNLLSLIQGRPYTITARVYPINGTVKMQLSGTATINEVTEATGGWETLTATYTPSGNENRSLQFIAEGGAAEFYVDSVSVIETADLAINGGMEADANWYGVNTPSVNERSTTQVDSGSYSRHVVAGAGSGIQGEAWDMVADRRYTLTARVYPVSGVVKMRVSGLSAGEALSSGTGAWKTLKIIHSPGLDKDDVHLQFVAEDGSAEFYVDTVTIQEERALSLNGGMEQDSDWSPVGTSTNLRRPRTDTGDFMYRVAANANEGIQSETWDMTGGQTYVLMARVYRESGSAKLQLLNASDAVLAEAASQATGDWETLRLLYRPQGVLDGVKLRLVAGAANTVFYADTAHVCNVTNLLRWQDFRYDGKGRTLEEASVSVEDASVTQRTTRTYHAFGNGNGLVARIDQHDVLQPTTTFTEYAYDSAGRVIWTKRGSLLGGCCATLTEYDAAGNVVSTTDIHDLEQAGDPTKSPVTTHRYDELGRRVEAVVYVGTPFEQSTLTFYDALGRVWRTIAHYQDHSYSAPGLWVWENGVWKDHAGGTVISHGEDNTENVIVDTAYNDLGSVRLRRDVLGNVTLYGYDDAGRLVKTVQNAATPGYNNNYTGTSPDPDLSAYPESTSGPDQDIITKQDYDANGNLVKSVDTLGRAIFTIYDALNRPVKMVRNAKDSATLEYDPGDSCYDAANDPRSDDYEPSSAPDRDQIERTEYDAVGRVRRTCDALGNWTLSGYDDLDRQVRTVRSASNPEYGLESDPSLSAYFVTGAADQDLMTQTEYDAAGRVLYSIDELGTKTRHVYDGLGRQAKAIANYVEQGTTDPADWVWSETAGRWEDGSNNAIDHGNNDQNIIAQTAYDADGRVQYTRDAEGKRTWHVYDSLGRQVKSITNFVPQFDGQSREALPDTWYWDENETQWEGTVPNLPPNPPTIVVIGHGPHNDENIISETVYDAQGRIQLTHDVRGNVTLFGYDTSGRRVKTVQNASNPGYNVNGDPDLSAYSPAGGAAPDQDRITTSDYDVAGRVRASVDAAGMETCSIYDRSGRRVRTISNYTPQGQTDPADWVWDEADGRWEDGSGNPIAHGPNYDQKLISDTVYNKAGQVVSTRDVRGTLTAFTYDQAGRRIAVTSASGTSQATTSYTCYDKGGRVLRMISNWVSVEGDPLPDERDTTGHWSFAPETHGALNDQNLITAYELDRAGRQVRVIDPVGNTTITAYSKDGRVTWTADAERAVTQYRYDNLRRLTRVVQGYRAVQPTAHKPVSFYSNRAGDDGEVYIMFPDGSGLENLTANAGSGNFTDIDPVWSPEGNRLAFVSSRTPYSWELYLMDADGANQERVNTFSGVGGTADYPTWSPDGTQLAFIGRASGEIPYGLYLVNRDGSNLRLLYTHESLDTYTPAWSPDGQKIVFTLDPGGIAEVYIINIDGTGPTNLTGNPNVFDGYPAWSPDGHQIAFQSNRSGHSQIYVMNADGSEVVNLSNNSFNDYVPSWSPDGEKIVFHRKLSDTDRDIYVMNADGSNQQALLTGTYNDQYARWSAYVVDPADWVWSAANSRWEDGSGNPIPHGVGWVWDATEGHWEDEQGNPIPQTANRDRNVIVTTEYDLMGRRTHLADPRGYVTAYQYDQLGRRTLLTDPLDHAWETEYSSLDGGTQTVLTDPNGVPTQRDFDRLGRLVSIGYDAPANTPDVTFTYDAAGNRVAMVEDDGTANIRITGYAYDDARRLKQVNFDTDGDEDIDESVSYAYDLRGQRTRLTLPGSLDVIYTYDQKGRLTGLTDWDGHTTTFTHDNANRLVAAERANGLRSRYAYDAAGRLRLLRHTQDARTLGHFAYEVDGRGNRIQALEVLAAPSTGGMVYAYDNQCITYHGAWTDSAPYKVSSSFSAALTLMFFGDTATLTIGTGPDHSIFDVYVNGSLWQSFDGYASANGERTIDITLASVGPHTLEIRNRHEKNLASTGYTLRFKQLVTPLTAYVTYTYDALARLQEARYNPASNLNAPDADLLHRYQYTYDLAGNRRTETVDGLPRYLGYNEANQLTVEGTQLDGSGQIISDYTYEYDGNGNLRYKKLPNTTVVDEYTWDRANRLTSMGGLSYAYDGLGNRLSQTANSIITRYLLDLQPGLVNVLAATTPSGTTRFVHGPRSILAHEDNAGAWSWMVQDGLGSVRGEVSDSVEVEGARSFAPYGTAFDPQGAFETPYAFTGEPLDDNGLVYLRARYYDPALGVFPSLDPVENRNRYQYVNGNPIRYTDPSGYDVTTSKFRIVSNGGYYGLGQIDLLEPNSIRSGTQIDIFLPYHQPRPSLGGPTCPQSIGLGEGDPLADYLPQPLGLSQTIQILHPGWEWVGTPQIDSADYGADPYLKNSRNMLIAEATARLGIPQSSIIPARVEGNQVSFFSDVDELDRTIGLAQWWGNALAIDPYVGSGSSASVLVIGEDQVYDMGGSPVSSPPFSSSPGRATRVTSGLVIGIGLLEMVIAASSENPYDKQLERILNRHYTNHGLVVAKLQRLNIEQSPHETCPIPRVDCMPTLYRQDNYQYRAILRGLDFFTVIDSNRNLHNYVIQSYVAGNFLVLIQADEVTENQLSFR